jgi:hypothetical protein
LQTEGTIMAKQKAKQESGKASKSSEVVISGRGLSFSVLDIDEETFERFTRTGISSEEFNDLREQLDDADSFITAPFLDETTVAIDGKEFHSSWENIKGQCGGALPAVTKIYAVPPGTHSVVQECIHEGDFAKARIAGFDPARLEFDIEHVELAKGRRHVLLDPYYKGDALASGDTVSDSDIYVVDGNGKRYEIKFAIGVVVKDDQAQ